MKTELAGIRAKEKLANINGTNMRNHSPALWNSKYLKIRQLNAHNINSMTEDKTNNVICDTTVTNTEDIFFI